MADASADVELEMLSLSTSLTIEDVIDDLAAHIVAMQKLLSDYDVAPSKVLDAVLDRLERTVRLS